MEPKSFKRFVTAGSQQHTDATTRQKRHSRKLNHMMSGREVRQMYEEILEMPETRPAETRPTTEIWISRRKSPVKYSKFDLFKSLHSADRTEAILRVCPDLVNEVDTFNWTALMMAACDGLQETCQNLLAAGADRAADDGKGNTALSLAVKKGHSRVVELLQSFGVEDSDSDYEESEPFWCRLCREKITEADRKSHEASTLHQFNCKSKNRPGPTSFGIPKTNRGYQIMLKQGWQNDAGLGPQQKGRKFPIKTVLRKDRQGLGTKQTPARVSHFAPNDLEAVKYKAPPVVKTRDDMKRERLKTRRLEHALRRELS